MTADAICPDLVVYLGGAQSTPNHDTAKSLVAWLRDSFGTVLPPFEFKLAACATQFSNVDSRLTWLARLALSASKSSIVEGTTAPTLAFKERKIPIFL